MPSLVRIGSVDVRLGEGQEDNLMDYSLSKSAPTMETVEEVMQLFESGGQVSAPFFCSVLLGSHVLSVVVFARVGRVCALDRANCSHR